MQTEETSQVQSSLRLWVTCTKWAQIACEYSLQIGLICVVSFTSDLQKLSQSNQAVAFIQASGILYSAQELKK